MRQERRYILSALAMLIAALVLGCDGGADGYGDADIHGDADSDGDAEVDAEGETLNLVVEMRPYGGGRAVVADALVAFDTPAGERLEARTDSDGRVSFEGFEWIEGETAALTVHNETLTLTSIVGLTEPFLDGAGGEDGAFHLAVFYPIEYRDLVEIGGYAANMENETNRLFVSSNVSRVGAHNAIGKRWSLMVEAGEPFFLVAQEFVWNGWRGDEFTQTIAGWGFFESDGVTERTQFDLDMGETLRVSTQSGSFPIPEWVSDRSSFRSYVQVNDIDSDGSLLIGDATRVRRILDDPSGEDRMEYSVEIVDLGDRVTPMTRVWSNVGERQSIVVVEGFPGGSLPSFPRPAQIIEPVLSGSERATPGTRITWEMDPSDARAVNALTSVVIVDGAGQLIHLVHVAGDASQAVVPEPTSNLDRTSYYDSSGFAMVHYCQMEEWSRDICTRLATSESIRFGP